MKRIIYIITASILLGQACKKQELKPYSGQNYLSFATDMKKDSITTSFFFYPDRNEIDIPLVIKLSGFLLNTDTKFKISVVEHMSTAKPENYEISPYYTFKAGQTTDTVFIKLIKTSDNILKSGLFSLVVKIDEDNVLMPGPNEYRMAKIVFSDLASKPEWWTKVVEKAYLGAYSEKKYQCFIIATKGRSSEFGPNENNPDIRRELALIFKYWLQAQKAAGHPVMDGEEEMKVTVIG